MGVCRHLIVSFLLFLAFMVSGRPASALVSDDPERAVPDLVIVPFANNTGQSQARLLLMPLLEKQLTERNLSLVTSAELRPLLRKNRAPLQQQAPAAKPRAHKTSL